MRLESAIFYLIFRTLGVFERCFASGRPDICEDPIRLRFSGQITSTWRILTWTFSMRVNCYIKWSEKTEILRRSEILDNYSETDVGIQAQTGTEIFRVEIADTISVSTQVGSSHWKFFQPNWSTVITQTMSLILLLIRHNISHYLS